MNERNDINILVIIILNVQNYLNVKMISQSSIVRILHCNKNSIFFMSLSIKNYTDFESRVRFC